MFRAWRWIWPPALRKRTSDHSVCGVVLGVVSVINYSWSGRVQIPGSPQKKHKPLWWVSWNVFVSLLSSQWRNITLSFPFFLFFFPLKIYYFALNTKIKCIYLVKYQMYVNYVIPLYTNYINLLFKKNNLISSVNIYLYILYYLSVCLSIFGRLHNICTWNICDIWEGSLIFLWLKSTIKYHSLVPLVMQHGYTMVFFELPHSAM